MSTFESPPQAGEVSVSPEGEIRAHLALKDRVFRWLPHTAKRWLLVLMVGEWLLLCASLSAATYLRFHATPALLALSVPLVLLRSAAFGTAVLMGMAALGLYQLHLRQSWPALLARQALGFAAGVLGLLVLYYALPVLGVGRGILAIALALAFVLIVALHSGFLRLADADLFRRRIVVLGAGTRAGSIAREMRRRVDRRGFTIVGFVVEAGDRVEVDADRIVTPDRALPAWAMAQHIDQIVVGPDERRGGLPMDELLQCKQAGIDVVDLSTFFERESGKITLGLTEPSWLIYSQGFNATSYRQISKRLFDLCAAALVLALAWPFMLLTALAIRLESGAGQPILYTQHRVGEGGQVFRLFKFRSMRTDAEGDGVAKWASKDDDRTTRVGRIIRRLRLDELPQLWNVLRGDMSVIGPRPERPEFVADLAQKIRYYTLRHCVKPGLAGWAQLRYPYGASEKDAAEKLKYDLYYVKNQSLLLDVLILIQTFEVVLFGRGVR